MIVQLLDAIMRPMMMRQILRYTYIKWDHTTEFPKWECSENARGTKYNPQEL